MGKTSLQLKFSGKPGLPLNAIIVRNSIPQEEQGHCLKIYWRRLALSKEKKVTHFWEVQYTFIYPIESDPFCLTGDITNAHDPTESNNERTLSYAFFLKYSKHSV